MAYDRFITLSDKADLQRLVDDGLEESLVLDYKASGALSRDSSSVNEICKDVSAFANSAGGQIVYGIEEDKVTHKSDRVDDGVKDQKVTREWIEQILNSRIQPRLHGVRVDRIQISPKGFAYVITIPPTQRGPHQAPDLKYYKRFELQSVPMHDYEIRDVMQRATTPHPFVSLSFRNGDTVKLEYAAQQDVSQNIPVVVRISNRASEPAMYAQVTIGVDADFKLVSSGSYQYVGTRKEGNQTFKLLRCQWAVNQKLPIFKEAIFPLVDVPFTIAVHSRYLGQSTRFEIPIEIVSPGFRSSETWYVMCQEVMLELLPPKPN